MSLTKASFSMISGTPISVLDHGADSTGAVDSTAAFASAFAEATSLKKAVYVPAGKYRIDSPVTTEAAPIGALTLIGESEVHHGYASADTEIDLSNNTQYFAAIGYGSKIKGISFFGAAGDVLHHTSTYPGGGTDGNFCILSDVSCIEFAGTFFKGFGTGNGSHISWDRVLLVSISTSSVVWDDTAVGFDNMTMNDCWVETASTQAFNYAAGTLAIRATRFVPYTNAGSRWFNFVSAPTVHIEDSDFGGESARTVAKWNAFGGTLEFNTVGFFSNAGTDTLLLVAPPLSINFSSCTTNGSSSPNLITISPSMTAANLANLSYMVVNWASSARNVALQLQGGDSPNNNVAAMLASQPNANVTNTTVKATELLATSGYPWASGGFATNVTSAFGTTVDVYGNSAYSETYTANAANASGYSYFNNGPGVSSLPNSEATYELLVEVSGGSVMFGMIFGSGDAGVNRKTFYLGPGHHHLCFPLLLTASMTRYLGFEFTMANSGTSVNVGRAKVFSGLYNSRKFELSETAAPSGVTYPWCVGDTVMNYPPVAGQPKGWVCTVAGAPGTWVSLGNL